MTPEERFSALAGSFASTPHVTLPGEGRGFGSTALRTHGKIFAMLVRGVLVVKLSKLRVEELVAKGEGTLFDANRGRPMKEWFCLDPESRLDWASLASEALDYVTPKQ
jgi:TfoX/Sxy family transcriptional regulator of competence genes